jgi:hypothetical protein
MSQVLGTSHKKIAIIGSAPSSINLAPYADPDWEMWGCSPGVFGVAPRTNAWFELHRFHPAQPGRNGAAGTVPHFSAEYTSFLRGYQERFNSGDGVVFMTDPIDSIPGAVQFPFEPLIKEHGEYFWTSTIAWMLALAIDQQPDEIGLWGVDMAASEEYAYQRPACQHFIRVARERGIKVTLPPESDLMQPPTKYGLDELNPRHIKIKSRIKEFRARIGANEQQISAMSNENLYLRGALDDAEYMLQSWAGDGLGSGSESNE